ncbi:hypothetical protein SCUP515_04498 [Seiridium cupressi]
MGRSKRDLNQKRLRRRRLNRRKLELQSSSEIATGSSNAGQITTTSYRDSLTRGHIATSSNVSQLFVFPGFYLTRISMHFPKAVEDVVLQAIGVTKFFEIRPRVLAWLIATFRVMYDGREAYILNDESNNTFYSAVVMEVARRGVIGAGIATHPTTTQIQKGLHPAADVEVIIETLKMIEPGVLKQVVGNYVWTRREFRDRSAQKERLVMKSKMGAKKATMNNDIGDDENDDEGTLVVEDDNGTDDKDDLFVRYPFEYHAEDHTHLENTLLGYVDRWISCLDQKAGTDIDDDLMKDLEMF